jgi:hypothetical protein
MECWYKDGKCLEEIPEGVFGYVYRVTNTLNGKIYIGKKQFLFKKKTRVGKRVIKATKTRKRVNVTHVDSGWKNYWGSSKSLLADIELLGKDKFKREILAFAQNKTELSYLEVHWQIQETVLHTPSYNGWISCRIFKSKL